MFQGWTAMWVGERAFRAVPSMKQQMEALGFMVRIYRGHEKCARAMDKKPTVPAAQIFVLSEADAEPMAQYLSQRGAAGLRIVVDTTQSTDDGAAARLSSSGVAGDLAVAGSWEEVLAALRATEWERPHRVLPAMPEAVPVPTKLEIPTARQSLGAAPLSHQAPPSPTLSRAGSPDGSRTWTLIWISAQAFKPAAVDMKAELEALGGQVKGYKTQKNAARALDKKRSLPRTVILVSGLEAAALQAYLVIRPDIAGTHVVVEVAGQPVGVLESETCEVVDTFEEALDAVERVTRSPDFQ